MTRTGILRIALGISLIFSACLTWIPPTFFHPVAQAQDKTGEPPFRQQSASAGNEDMPLPRTSISINVDMVSLQVLVSDSNGNVLTGLKPENFTIYEDNVKQEIRHFSPVEANITVVMLVEFSKRIEYFLNDVYNAMNAFMKTLRPKDWTAVMGYDMHTTIFQDFTQDRREVYNALRQFTIPAWNESNISDAVIEAIDRTQEIEGKVAILLISSGLDTFSRHTYDQALASCKNANASVYAIGVGRFLRDYLEPRGEISPAAISEFLMGENRLKSFADYTGGAAWFPRYSTELPAIFESFSKALRSQYSIGYTSTNTKKDGKFRKIRVEVKTDLTDSKGKPLKLKIVTRKGYTPKSI